MFRFKTPILLILGFVAGYMSTIILPDYSWQVVSSKVQQNTLGVTSTQNDPTSEFITRVDFDGTNFKPTAVTIKKTYKLNITNTSKTAQMWLKSDNPVLSTTRGYGESERLMVQLDLPGSYKVINKIKEGNTLSVKVNP